jgi:hypothetical protein
MDPAVNEGSITYPCFGPSTHQYLFVSIAIISSLLTQSFTPYVFLNTPLNFESHQLLHTGIVQLASPRVDGMAVGLEPEGIVLPDGPAGAGAVHEKVRPIASLTVFVDGFFECTQK